MEVNKRYYDFNSIKVRLKLEYCPRAPLRPSISIP